MKKRTLTPDQVAARDARREKFKAITKTVAALTDDQRGELARTMGAVQTCEGRSLSVKNTCLLAYQFPHATLVGGFRQWLRQGRCVKKGEHGASIWIPLNVKSETEGEGSDVRFGSAVVFDVSQTNEIEADHPVATVAPEIAAAFGMTDLPNVRVQEAQNEFSLE